MKDSPKLSPTARKRLLIVLILSILGIGTLAAVVPKVLTGPIGGQVEDY